MFKCKKKFVFAGFGIVLSAILCCSFLIGNNYISGKKAEAALGDTCVHDGNYYPAVNPTSTESGHVGFGACCKCHERFEVDDISELPYGTWTTKSSKDIPLDQPGDREKRVFYVNLADGYSGEKTSVNARYGSTMPSVSVPTRPYYDFLGYFDDNGTQFYNDQGIGTKTYDLEVNNYTLTARWELHVYTILLNNQGADSSGTGEIYLKYSDGYYLDRNCTTKMTTGSNPISIPNKTGYTFTGYFTGTGGSGKQYITADGYLSAGAGNADFTSGVTLYANYSLITYTLSYNLDGGSVSSPNPTSYNVTTPTFTLNNPTKTGYVFAGWTGTGISGTSSTVTISTGSTGNRSYTATWSPATNTKFVVEHYLQNLNASTYSLDKTETKYGTTGATITNQYISYTGFNANSESTDSIAPDGSTIHRCYYNRQTFTITISVSGKGSVSKTSITGVPYGASVSSSGNTVNINGTQVTATASGYDSSYHYSFSNWTNGSFTVTGAATITANFTGTAHSYTDTVITAPTCTTTGTKRHTCSCGYYYDETMSALGHDFSKQVITNDYLKSSANCTSPAVYYYACSRCGAKGTNTYTYGSALGHNFSGDTTSTTYLKSAATCTAAAVYYNKCSRCGASSQNQGNQTHTVGGALGHSWSLSSVTWNGQTSTANYKCTRCSATTSNSQTGTYQVTRNANCVTTLQYRYYAVWEGTTYYSGTYTGNTDPNTHANLINELCYACHNFTQTVYNCQANGKGWNADVLSLHFDGRNNVVIKAYFDVLTNKPIYDGPLTQVVARWDNRSTEATVNFKPNCLKSSAADRSAGATLRWMGCDGVGTEYEGGAWYTEDSSWINQQVCGINGWDHENSRATWWSNATGFAIMNWDAANKHLYLDYFTKTNTTIGKQNVFVHTYAAFQFNSNNGYDFSDMEFSFGTDWATTKWTVYNGLSYADSTDYNSKEFWRSPNYNNGHFHSENTWYS